MSGRKWKAGDWAMLPVRIKTVTGLTSVEVDQSNGWHIAHVVVDLANLRPVDPPGHGRHIDADALMRLLEGRELVPRIGIWGHGSATDMGCGWRMCLDTIASIVRAALAAQEADHE